MDITNWENFAECHSNHIYDVVLSSQVMTAKASVASLDKSSVNTNSQTIDPYICYNIFNNLLAAYSEVCE